MSSQTGEALIQELKNDTYIVNAEIEGGNGTDMICTPMSLFVKNGEATAVVVWTTSSCDYMKIGEEQYTPMSRDESSVFYLPVPAWDEEIEILANLGEGSEKQEVAYTVTFDSASITAMEKNPIPLLLFGGLTVILSIANVISLYKRRLRYADRVEKKKRKKF